MQQAREGRGRLKVLMKQRYRTSYKSDVVHGSHVVYRIIYSVASRTAVRNTRRLVVA